MSAGGSRDRAFFEQAPDGMAVIDAETGRIRDVNPAFCDHLGYSREAVLDQAVSSLTPEGWVADGTLLERLTAACEANEYVEWYLSHGDGTQSPVTIKASRLDGDGACLLVRVTERSEREREHQRFQQLVAHLPVGVFRNTPGPDGEFIEVNDALVSMFGADSKAQLRARDACELYADPEDRQEFSDRLLADGVVYQAEQRFKRLDGELFWGALTAVTVEEDGQTYFEGIVQDITQRKQYEQRLEQQRDNLDVLNQVVRHDIRNDIQLIMAYADLLADHVDETGLEYLEKVDESAKNAVELTQTAREIADTMLQTDADLEPVSLRKSLITQVEKLRTTTDDAVVSIATSIPDVDVLADEMLDSVFRNVLTNAVEHNDSSPPEVTVSVIEHDREIVVRVADNGPGVPDDRKEEIFGKGEKGLDSDGTGIGLYLVHTLVDQYGGEVWVTDTETGGAEFAIELQQA